MSEACAVVLGMGPVALTIVRALGRRGVKVFGVSSCRSEATLSSKYCKGLGIADPVHASEKLREILLSFAKRKYGTKKVLYPSGDEYVAFIVDNDNWLKSYYLYPELCPDVAKLFLSKRHFYTLCRRSFVPTAQTFFPTTISEARALIGKIPFPCFLKPEYYHLWREEFGLTKGFLCQNAKEYTQNLDKVAHLIGSILVQEVIEGLESNLRFLITYIGRNGEPLGLFTGRKIRQYPAQFGTGCAAMSSYEPELVEPSLNLLRTAGYKGFAEVEFKWSGRDKQYKAIEVNIRPCRFCALVEGAGVDLLYRSFLDICGCQVSHCERQRDGVAWFFTTRDILAILGGLAKKKLRLSDVTRSYKGPKTWCIWARDDIKPFFTYPVEILVKKLRITGKRVASKAAILLLGKQEKA